MARTPSVMIPLGFEAPKFALLDVKSNLIMKSDDNRALRTEFYDIIQSLGTAKEIFRNDYDSDPPDILNIEKYLLSKDEDALRLCKIWTDIAEYKE